MKFDDILKKGDEIFRNADRVQFGNEAKESIKQLLKRVIAWKKTDLKNKGFLNIL